MNGSESEQKERILRAAAECIAQYGISGATIRTIAKHAGISLGMLQYYYPTKKDLMAATHDAAVRRLRERANAQAGHLVGVPRLAATFGSLGHSGDESTPPWNFWLWYWAEATLDADFRAQHEDQLSITREILAESIRAGIASGDLRSDLDPLLTADVIYSLLHGLGMESLIAPQVLPPARAAEAAALFLRLLKPEAASMEAKNDSTSVGSAKPPLVSR